MGVNKRGAGEGRGGEARKKKWPRYLSGTERDAGGGEGKVRGGQEVGETKSERQDSTQRIKQRLRKGGYCMGRDWTVALIM